MDETIIIDMPTIDPNLLATVHRLGSCRKIEGVPASIGAFSAATIPSFIQKDRFQTLSFGEIPTSFYMGIVREGLRGVVLSDLTSKSRHMKFPTSDKIGVVVRTGEPKDYLHYFQGKDPHFKPSVVFGWEIFDQAKFKSIIDGIGKDYAGEFGYTLFYCYHFGELGRQINKFGYINPVKLWSVNFEDTIFERDLDKSMDIIAARDNKLRDIRFQDDKADERKAIRKESQEAIEAITKYLPFSLSCFLIAPYATHQKVSGIKASLSQLQPETLEKWDQTATQCRIITESALRGLESTFEQYGKAVNKQIAERSYIMDLGRIPEAPKDWQSNTISLTHSLKVKRSNKAGAFLKYDNNTFAWFNSAEGRPTGIESALLSRPNLLGRGVKDASQILEALGYEIKLSDDLVQRLERKRNFYKFQESPLHELQGHELIAYYNHGKYKCKKTVTNPQTKEKLWVKGKEYEIIPTWAKTMYAGGSEPIVDETNNIVGVEELSVRLSYLQLKVQTEAGKVIIAENQCRENTELEEEIDEITGLPKAAKTTEWIPMLDEFVEGFGLPEVPTIMELRPKQLATFYKKLMKAMPDLKPYQADCCIRNATKKGGIIGGTMGSGKTRMIIGTLLLRDHMFNLIIVPPMLVDSWMSHFKMYNLYAERLLSHESLNTLTGRYKALKGLTPIEKRKRLHSNQEFYVTTPEFLTLGGVGNLVYDEWKAIYESKEVELDPITGEPIFEANGRRKYNITKHELTCTKYHAKAEHLAAKIPTGTRHNYWDHVKECPKCKADRQHFTEKGFCHNCGHSAFSYKGVKSIFLTCENDHKHSLYEWLMHGHCPDCELATPKYVDFGKEESLDMSFINNLLEGTKGKSASIKTKSFYAFPAYKRIRGIFGAKAIDEVHLLANFSSQRGLAVFGINTKETWAASGTIARGYVTDLEASLCHVHGANTPIFPFYPWGKGREGFREQFVTERVKAVNNFDGEKRRVSASPMPEASNLNRLRRMLNCVTTTVGESMMEKEWKLPPIKRKYEEIILNPDNQTRYLQELTNIKSWFSGASSVERHRGALAKLWNLRMICDGEEKEAVVEKYVQQWIKEDRKFVLTASTKTQYKKLCKLLDRNKVRYLAIDEKISADKRDEATSKFEDPNIQAVVSRTRLINVGLNTLVHADRLLISSLEYSPDILRQMEKRICRPGQVSDDLLVVYPIVRMKPKASVEEKMLKLNIEKELAVKEMIEGKIRWQSAAELLESAREKKGAAKVLSDIMDTTEESTNLDDLFTKSEVVQAVDLTKEVEELEKGHHLVDEENIGEERIQTILQGNQYMLLDPAELTTKDPSQPPNKKPRKVVKRKAKAKESMDIEMLLNLW